MSQERKVAEYEERHTRLHPDVYCCRLTPVPAKDGSLFNICPQTKKELHPTMLVASDETLQKLARPDMVTPLVPDDLEIKRLDVAPFMDALDLLEKQSPGPVSRIPGVFPRPDINIHSLDECIIDGLKGYRQVPGGIDHYLIRVLRVTDGKNNGGDGGGGTDLSFYGIEHPRLYKSVFGTGPRTNARLLVHTAVQIIKRSTESNKRARCNKVVHGFAMMALKIYGTICGRFAKQAHDPDDAKDRFDASRPPYIQVGFVYRDRELTDGFWTDTAEALKDYKNWDQAQYALDNTFSMFLAAFLLFLHKIAIEEGLAEEEDEDEYGKETKKKKAPLPPTRLKRLSALDADEKKKQQSYWPLNAKAIRQYVHPNWSFHYRTFLATGNTAVVSIRNIKSVFDQVRNDTLAGKNGDSSVQIDTVEYQHFATGYSIHDRNRVRVKSATEAPKAIRTGAITSCNWTAFIGLPEVYTSIDMDPYSPAFTVHKLHYHKEDGTLRVTREAEWEFVFQHTAIRGSDFSDNEEACRMWIERHGSATTAVRYRYAWFRGDDGRMHFTPPLHRLYRLNGGVLVNECSPLTMGTLAFEWAWKTNYKEPKRGMYSFVPMSNSNAPPPVGSLMINAEVCIQPAPSSSVQKQMLAVPPSTSDNKSLPPPPAVPRHFIEFTRAVPVLWMLSAILDANVLEFFPARVLPRPPERVYRGKNDPKQRSQMIGDYRGIREGCLEWFRLLNDSGFKGIADGAFVKNHPVRLCWDLYSLYALATLDNGDEISAIKQFKESVVSHMSSINNNNKQQQLVPEVVYEQLCIGCRMWHALLARRSRQSLAQISATAVEIKMDIDGTLLDAASFSIPIRASPVDQVDKVHTAISDKDGSLLKFVTNRLTGNTATGLIYNKKFWKEFVSRFHPEVAAGSQLRERQLVSMLADPSSTDPDLVEAEWPEGSVDLYDYQISGESEIKRPLDGAIVVRRCMPLFTDSHRVIRYKSVEFVIRAIRARAFLSVIYPILLSLGSLFPNEHIKYTDGRLPRTAPPRSYMASLKQACEMKPQDVAVTLDSIVQATDGFVIRQLQLGNQFRTYKRTEGRTRKGGNSGAPAVDYKSLAKEVKELPMLPRLKIPYYQSMLAALEKQQQECGAGSRGALQLAPLIAALEEKLQFAGVTYEFMQTLIKEKQKKKVGDSVVVGRVTTQMLLHGIGMFMLKGSSQDEAVSAVCKLVLGQLDDSELAKLVEELKDVWASGHHSAWGNDVRVNMLLSTLRADSAQRAKVRELAEQQQQQELPVPLPQVLSTETKSKMRMSKQATDLATSSAVDTSSASEATNKRKRVHFADETMDLKDVPVAMDEKPDGKKGKQHKPVETEAPVSAAAMLMSLAAANNNNNSGDDSLINMLGDQDEPWKEFMSDVDEPDATGN